MDSLGNWRKWRRQRKRGLYEWSGLLCPRPNPWRDLSRFRLDRIEEITLSLAPSRHGEGERSSPFGMAYKQRKKGTHYEEK